MGPATPEPQRSSLHEWIRNNVLGLVAIFIALNGSAVAAQMASDAKSDTASASKKQKAKAAAKKGKRGPQGPPGQQGPQGAQGLQGPQGPAGSAPTSLNLASSSPASPAITFGPGGAEMYNLFGDSSVAIEATGGFHMFASANMTGDVSLPNATSTADAMTFGAAGAANLYRSAADTLHTDDSLDVGGNTTLGDASADTATINAGPIDLPNATAAADGLVFGSGAGTAELHRNGIDILRTNDSLQVGGIASAEDGVNVVEGLIAGPAAPDSGVTMFVTCVAGTTFLNLRWEDGDSTVLTSNATGCAS